MCSGRTSHKTKLRKEVSLAENARKDNAAGTGGEEVKRERENGRKDQIQSVEGMKRMRKCEKRGRSQVEVNSLRALFSASQLTTARRVGGGGDLNGSDVNCTLGPFSLSFAGVGRFFFYYLSSVKWQCSIFWSRC